MRGTFVTPENHDYPLHQSLSCGRADHAQDLKGQVIDSVEVSTVSLQNYCLRHNEHELTSCYLLLFFALESLIPQTKTGRNYAAYYNICMAPRTSS